MMLAWLLALPTMVAAQTTLEGTTENATPAAAKATKKAQMEEKRALAAAQKAERQRLAGSQAAPTRKATARRSAEDVVELPYTQDFEEGEDLEDDLGFTVIDANDDWATWSLEDGVAEYSSLFADADADDWLITPGFRLEEGKSYQFSFTAWGFDTDTPEQFEAKLGTDADADAMATEVIALTVVESDQPQVYTATLSVEEAGVYYLGIHCLSPEDGFSLYIDDLSIKEGAAEAAPSGVEELTITADPEGDLSADISFVTPTQAVDGTALSALTAVSIFRGNADEPLTTFDSPAVGTQLTYTDASPENGSNIYTVIAYNDAGEGTPVSQTVFVGVDQPSAPTEVKATNEGSDVVITWSASDTGWNGHYVNPDRLTYTIYEMTSALSREMLAENVSGNSYTLAGENEKEQRQITYQIIAHNVAGDSQRGYSNTIITGKPYELPFHESVSSGTGLDNKLWILDRTNSQDGLYATSASQDGDGGAIILRGGAANHRIVLMSGKIAVGGTSETKLRFWYHFASESANTVGVQVVKDGEVLLSEAVEAADEWTEKTISLDEVTTNDYVQIYFTVDYGDDHADVVIDNILVDDALTDGIHAISTTQPAAAAVYSLGGQQLQKPVRGLNIVRTEGGEVKKVVVR